MRISGMPGASCRQSFLVLFLTLSPAGSSGSGGGRAGLFSDGPRPSQMGRHGNATSTAPPSPAQPLILPPSSTPPSFSSPSPPGGHNSPRLPPPCAPPPLAPVSAAMIAVGASAAALALIGGAWGVSRLMRRPGGFGRIFGRRRARLGGLGLLSDPLNSLGSLPPRSRLSLLSDPLNAMGTLPPVAPATPPLAESDPATTEFEARGVATSRLVPLSSSS